MRPDPDHLFDRAEASPEFRARLRDAFVDGSIEPVREAALGEGAREVLRGALRPEPAARGFAADLRERFARGPALVASDDGGAEVHAFGEARAARRRSLVASFASALVAAALLLFVVTEFLDRGPRTRWNVYNPDRAVATLDGRPLHVRSVDVGDEPCTVCTGSGNLRLGLDDGVRVELSAKAEARFHCTYTEDGGLVCVPITIERGELVALAKRGAPPVRFDIDTPAALVKLEGTAISVFPHKDNGSLCVVVRSGEAVVDPKIGDAEPLHVGSGQRVLVRADGSMVLSEHYDGVPANERRLRNLDAACSDLDDGRFDDADYDRAFNALEAL
ncbi:MAG: FecR domain-containing protein [Planctomycetota bacterium]